MFRTKSRALVLVGGLLAATSVIAQVPKPLSEQIKDLNYENALLQARKANVDLEAAIVSKQAETAKARAAMVEAETAPKPVAAGQRAEEEDEPLPVVQAIEGADGNLVVTLLTARGQQVVRRGEKVLGGWLVAVVQPTMVVLTRGKESVRLSFGSTAAQAAQRPSQQLNTTGQVSSQPMFQR